MITLVIVLLAFHTQTTRSISEHDIPEIRYLDTSADPCDDFYQFSCGNFDKYHQRPIDQSVLDLFTMTEDEMVQVGHEILSSPKDHEDPLILKKIKSAYKACVDVDYADTIKFPELRLIEEFGGMPLINTGSDKISWKAISQMVGTTGIHQIFDLKIQSFNPDETIILLCPDMMESLDMIRPKYTKSYDEVLEESFKDAAKQRLLKQSSGLDAFDVFLFNISKNIVTNSYVRKSDAEITKDVEDVRTFFTLLLRGGIVDDDMLPLNMTTTIKELQDWTNRQFGDEIQIDWLEYIGGIFKWAGIDITEDTVIYNTGNISVYGPLNLIRKTDPKVVQNFILLRSFIYLAADSDAPLRQAFEDYYRSKGLHFYNRQEYCTRKILDVVDSVTLSFAVAYPYQRYHFDENKIRKTVRMINELRHAHKTLLRDSDWIDDESRDHLLKKVDNMIVSLAYPDLAMSQRRVDAFYENVRICEWDNYGNARRMRAFGKAYALTQLTEKGKFWGYSPFNVNAYTMRPYNKILIPVSMLQDGFFPGRNAILDYSRLGTTIAHEMTHNFDSWGIRYNETGYQVVDFLTNATKQEIEVRMQCLIDQYSNFFVPEINATVNGEKTLDENFCDNGGMRKAFLAYQRLIRRGEIRNTSKIYTLEQLFFIGFGTMWCSQESENYLRQLVNTNQHAPSRVRVLGTLANFDEFSRAFHCPVGSNMNPEKKCVVW